MHSLNEFGLLPSIAFFSVSSPDRLVSPNTSNYKVGSNNDEEEDEDGDEDKNVDVSVSECRKTAVQGQQK